MMVNGATTNYQYNALDQLTSAGSVTYQYNGRGDLTQITNGSSITNYTYDAADRLTSVTAPGVSASYAYDADGRRVKQTVGSTVTNYQWDEASTYGDVVNEYNNSGSTLASYVLGDTGLISQTRGTTTNYFLQDGQRSTRALTSSAGAVTDTYSYTAFGELFNQTGSTANSYLYTGQQFDSLTGLYSLRARYYNPALGRFLSQDTYPVNFNNPVELNRYVYTGNSPINRADPTGDMFIEYAINVAETTVVAAGVGELFRIASAALCGGGLLEGAKTGFWFGAGFGAGSIIVPGVTSVAGLGLGACGAGTSFYDIYKKCYMLFKGVVPRPTRKRGVPVVTCLFIRIVCAR
jgi:RHS repeat-associated protein